MPSDDRLPYKYRNTDDASCSPPDNGDRGFCSDGVGGDLPTPGPIVSYSAGQVNWLGTPLPPCATGP